MCKTDLRLSGTVYDDNYPERSFALFQQKEHAGAIYREGMWVLTYEIVVIEPRGVLLRDEQGECWLRLVGNPERSHAAPPPRKNKGKKGKRAKKPAKPKGFVVIGKH